VQSVQQEPIYLRGVENNPQPRHSLNLTRTSQSREGETWNIRYLLPTKRMPIGQQGESSR